MPTYDFLNTKTGKEFSEFMSISEKETYLKHNSHIQQKVSSINIISGTGGIKNDGERKELQSKITERNPGTPMQTDTQKNQLKKSKQDKY